MERYDYSTEVQNAVTGGADGRCGSQILKLMANAGKGGHLLIDVLGSVGRGKDPWTEKQRAVLRRLAVQE